MSIVERAETFEDEHTDARFSLHSTDEGLVGFYADGTFLNEFNAESAGDFINWFKAFFGMHV